MATFLRSDLASSALTTALVLLFIAWSAHPLPAGDSGETEAQAKGVSRGESLTVRLSLRAAGTASNGGGYRVVGALRGWPERDAIFSDGFESGDTSAWSATYPATGVPAGTVMMFDLATCPSGWSLLTAAAGRALVGVPAGGSLAGLQGAPLADLEMPSHDHSFNGTGTSTSAPPHNHWWSILWTDRHWTTYDQNYGVHTIFEWGDGVDDSGEGYYPFSAAPDTSFGTNDAGGHQHAFTMSGTTASAAGQLPYLQLLVCAKD